ncbi:MauE/DoxX family redox-associated membrane protein [Sphingobacterium paucimobilis]|uniref:Methylamine utilisation protein MauE domain-containing protein n=1 Tax=Sphingobacterium paucimobilis HER1398 TaxID=1346330 RepID=U2IXM0_9SPHI|nr:MauE/DoxX family redox-associated membrane protein [Sphingobacterium paucimobilis]ERJ57449.1 hypothetical protein M472_01585 [Sphingobacterium paucimobilis HER1398]
MNKLKRIIIQAPRYIIAFLLFYTAAKKFVNYDAHLAHIRDVGIVPAGIADSAAIASIAVEAGVALLLVLNYRKAQVLGCCILILLMLAYSRYVYFIQNKALFVPCSCEGIHGKLSWTMHYWINGSIAVLALAMLYMLYRMHKQKNDEALGKGSIKTVQTI